MPGARRAGGVRRGDPDRSTVAEHERRVGPLLSDLHQALDHPYPQLGERLTATAPRVASCAGGGDDLGLLLLHVRDAPARPGAHADLTETRILHHSGTDEIGIRLRGVPRAWRSLLHTVASAPTSSARARPTRWAC